MPRRTDDDFIDAILEELNPAATEREAVTRKVRDYVLRMRAPRGSPSPYRTSTPVLQRYRTRLIAAKSDSPEGDVLGDGFPAALEAHIAKLDQMIRRRRRRPRDPIARRAAWFAAMLLPPAQFTLTRERKAHQVAALFFEAGSGREEHADKVLNYMREIKQNRLLDIPRPRWRDRIR
jgi:hypothetical protein